MTVDLSPAGVVRRYLGATMPGMKMYRLEAGQIVEFWGETDLLGLLRGLGLVPHEMPSLA